EPGGSPEEICAGTISSDPSDLIDQLEEALPDDPELVDEVTTLIEDFQAAFGDLGPLGITVSEVDGAGYVSPLGTTADFGLTVLDALDRDEFETLIDDAEGLVEAAQDSSYAGSIDLPPIGG